MSTDPEFVHVSDKAAVVRFQQSVYGIDPILKAAHRFTDRCHVHAEQSDGMTIVRLTARTALANLRHLAGEFANEVLDQRLRATLAEQTEPIRRLLIAQAFSKVDLLHPGLEGADPLDDPARIGEPDA